MTQSEDTCWRHKMISQSDEKSDVKKWGQSDDKMWWHMKNKKQSK